MAGARRALRRWVARYPLLESLIRLVFATVRICLRYRVTGLASEAGFFALLSMPPLVLGLFGGVGYVGQWLGRDDVHQMRAAIEQWAGRFLTPDIIDSTLSPTVDDVFRGGRFDLISLGFLLSLWSGSRALNVFLDTISIMYGQSGVRGIIRTRTLSFSLYAVTLVVGSITFPLFLIGPSLLSQILPDNLQFLVSLYWPVVSILTIANLTSLFHVATPKRSPWTHDVPGAVLTLVIWVIASYVVRHTIAASLGGTSIYGPLSAPIVLLIWLYFLAIAVLIGAAFNAAVRTLWPAAEPPPLRTRLRTLMEVLAGTAAERPARGIHRKRPAYDPDDYGIGGVWLAIQGPLTPVWDRRGREAPPARPGTDGSATSGAADAAGTAQDVGTVDAVEEQPVDTQPGGSDPPRRSDATGS